MSLKSLLPIFLLAAIMLAGCSASGDPRLIAAFPLAERGSVPQPPPPPVPPAYPQPQAFIYNAHLGIEAWRPSRAVDRAVELAARYSGYLVSSHTWSQEGEERVSLALAVPVYNFDALYADLQGLGVVVSQQVWGEWRAYAPGGGANYSQITLEIAPRRLSLPAVLPDGWSPGRTFASALRISASVFRFLVDAAIWLLVVVAPFALLFLGLRLVIRKLRQEDRQSYRS
jgi:hypothetical protein